MDAVVPLSAAQVSMEKQAAAKDGYLLRVLVALDIAANVALGGAEDETISAHAALMARKHEFLGVVVSRMLNLFQADHGAKAAAGDLERAEALETAVKASGLAGS